MKGMLEVQALDVGGKKTIVIGRYNGAPRKSRKTPRKSRKTQNVPPSIVLTVDQVVELIGTIDMLMESLSTPKHNKLIVN